MSRMRVMGTAQVNSSEKDGNEGNIRRAMKSSASPDDFSFTRQRTHCQHPNATQRPKIRFPKKIKKQQPAAPALEMSHNASVTALAAFAAAQGR